MALDLSRYALGFSIKIAGKEDKELVASIQDLKVEQHLEGSSAFSFSLIDPIDQSTQRFKWLDGKALDPQRSDVSVQMGYVTGMKTVILGRIAALEPRFNPEGPPTLNVQGYDHYEWLKHSLATVGRTFQEAETYGDIVGKIATFNKLDKGKIEPRAKPCSQVAKSPDQTDAQFLEGLAERLGHEVFVREKKLYFQKPKYKSKEVATLEWGVDLISFEPRLSTAQVVVKVTVIGRNEKTAKEVKGEATLSDLDYKESKAKSAGEILKSYREVTRRVTNIPVSCEAEAKVIAKAILERSNSKLITCTCKCLGNPDLVPGSNIMIKGVGKRFSGRYYLTKSTHEIGGSGYTTTLDLRRGLAGNV